jgi:hypothetical protein
MIGELLVGLLKMLSYAKACCKLKGINSVLNVIEEVGWVVIDGTLLVDKCMKFRFIGQP